MSHVPRLLSLSASAEIAVLIVNQTRDGKLGLFCFASQFTAAVNGTGKLGFTRSYWHGMRTFQCKRSSDTTLAVQCTAGSLPIPWLIAIELALAFGHCISSPRGFHKGFLPLAHAWVSSIDVCTLDFIDKRKGTQAEREHHFFFNHCRNINSIEYIVLRVHYRITVSFALSFA